MAGTGALALWLWLEVSAFASIPTVQRIEERNLFYVAPFFLIALLLWARLGAPRRLPWAVVVALGSGALVAAIPFVRFIGLTATSDTFALLPWWKLQEHVITLHQVRPIATVCALAAGALFLVVPRRYALVLPLLVLVYFAAEQRPIESRTTLASRGALFQGIRGVQPDWIDRAVGRNADVAAIWTGKPDVHVIWENEFFNRSVGPILDTGAAIPGGLPSTAVTIDPHTGLVRAGGKLVRHRYALVDSSLELNGKVVASDPLLGVSLYRLDGPLRSMTTVTGLYPNDTWSGPRVVYTRHVCNGGAVAATVLGDPTLFRAPQRVTANGRTYRHARQAGHADRAAAELPRGLHGQPDPRAGERRPAPAGIHFLGFDVPPRSAIHLAVRLRRTCRRREDRVRRVAALASAQRRRQLHPRLARGARRGGRRAPRDRRLRADEPGREAGDPRGARGDRRRDADRLPAVRARLAHGLEPPAVAGRRTVPRPLRRAPLHRLDVPAPAGRAPLDDGARPRPAALPGVGAEAHRVDARREVPPHGAGL